MWGERIASSTDANNFLVALKNILSSRGKKTAHELLTTPGLPQKYQDFHKQHSSAELFTDLIEKLPADFQDDVFHIQQRQTICCRCGSIVEGQEGKEEEEVHFTLTLSEHKEACSIFADWANSFGDVFQLHEFCKPCDFESAEK